MSHSNRLMTNKILTAGVFALLALAPACTDLTEVPQSAITPENFYRNADEALGGLASVYAQLRTTYDNSYNISEITTDEMIVPTRGQDWFDNGKWLDLHRQTFTPNSPAGLDLINNSWTDLFIGIARANVVMHGIATANFEGKQTMVAELRVLRAFYYYMLQDLFGGVPIVCEEEGNPLCTGIDIAARPRNTRAEVFSFIESELKAAKPDLPATWPADMNGRVTQGTVDAILASMYLNAQVYTGTVSATGLQPGAARWQDALDEANAVINSGNYTLTTDANQGCTPGGCGWRKNFTADNNTSPEIIFAIKFVAVTDLGNNFLMRALHYHQYSGANEPWNGFSTLADTYASFDPNDERKQIFLAGPQVNLVTGQPATDRQGNPLFFDPNIPDPTSATEGQGVRIAKWPVDPAHVNQDAGNDYAWFRLGEMYLIRAEAENELGQTALAIADINTIRARVNAPALAAGLTQQQVRDAILKERLFELTAEGKRRTDLIRFGQFTSGTWYAKTTNLPYKILFPIPQTQIETNPALEQNPGY
ncbi:MAG TPA: RagB/SusD family nutrient uptake outer membrane protein [Gemmatimonadaceae bacterium]|nr:RagB/SusD family nutrient uptake outer membrane protein [Gemmatimonadaceae bacterium]